MRFFLLLALFILGFTGIRAQDASLVPALLQQYDAAQDDLTRTRLLALISFHMVGANPDSSLLTGEQALVIAEGLQNAEAIGDAHNSLGWLAAQQGNIDLAEGHLQQALRTFEKTKDRAKTSAVRVNMGWLAQNQGNHVLALDHFLSALRDAESVQDSVKLATINYSIGITYRKTGDDTQALEYLQRSLMAERALGRGDREGRCLMSIANVYRDRGDRAMAMQTYRLATEIFASIRDHAGMGMVQENIGDLLLEHAPTQALAHYSEALKEYEISGGAMDKAYVLRSIGLVHLRSGHPRKALEVLETGRALASEARAMDLLMDYERSFAELATVQGDAAGVSLHLNRFMALKDSLQGERAQRDLARLRTEFEAERKEADNALLREQNSTQQQHLRNRELQLYGSVAVALLALLAALLTWRNLRQRRKHTAVLETLNAKLASSHAEISEINDLLKLKVLRSQMNPHFIYNCLTSAATRVQAGQQAEALTYLQGFARLLRMVLEHGVNDHIALEEEVEFLNLYLKLETSRMPQLTYSVEMGKELVDDDAELPALLVQPFVENAIWHGLSSKEGERHLRIHFFRNEQGLTCTITDNGIGREQAAGRKKESHHKSLGIQLTNERLRLLTYHMSKNETIKTIDLTDVDGLPTGTQVILQL